MKFLSVETRSVQIVSIERIHMLPTEFTISHNTRQRRVYCAMDLLSAAHWSICSYPSASQFICGIFIYWFWTRRYSAEYCKNCVIKRLQAKNGTSEAENVYAMQICIRRHSYCVIRLRSRADGERKREREKKNVLCYVINYMLLYMKNVCLLSAVRGAYRDTLMLCKIILQERLLLQHQLKMQNVREKNTIYCHLAFETAAYWKNWQLARRGYKTKNQSYILIYLSCILAAH